MECRSAAQSDPRTFTIVLYRPRIRNVGAHWPTNMESRSRPMIFSVSDVAIDAPASHRKVSDGSLAVCCSIVRATTPSECSGGVTVLMGDLLCQTHIGERAALVLTASTRTRSRRD